MGKLITYCAFWNTPLQPTRENNATRFLANTKVVILCQGTDANPNLPQTVLDLTAKRKAGLGPGVTSSDIVVATQSQTRRHSVANVVHENVPMGCCCSLCCCWQCKKWPPRPLAACDAFCSILVNKVAVARRKMWTSSTTDFPEILSDSAIALHYGLQ